MDRQPPSSSSDSIDLYIRTYYSLLRSSGDVRVRALEEAHAWSDSSLHEGARSPDFDAGAFAYAAARLPDCLPRVSRIVIGQSHEQFEAAHLPVRTWARVRTRGRRRPLRWDGAETLAVFATSTSDIDDLVPIVTAYQIEWNKLHEALRGSPSARSLPLDADATDLARISAETRIPLEPLLRAREALGDGWAEGLRAASERACDLRIRLLNGSFNEFQRAAQRWWSGVEPSYLRETPPRRPPIYFVSSNAHSLANLLGGYARKHREPLLEFARAVTSEPLGTHIDRALEEGREDEISNLLYYVLRGYMHAGGEERRRAVQQSDALSGIVSVESPGKVDVSAQRIELSQLVADACDERVRVPGMERLRQSDAVILNIDYPLGLAAYHHLSRVAQGAGDVRGVYVMGKAATLNARVGDVMVSNVVHDEHSKNTYLLPNCFTADDVQPYLRHGTVLDNQKALTVRSAFLQNRDYMSVFYREGFTVLEMEAGPYMSSIYELVSPGRHPDNEVVHLSSRVKFDLGLLHYASDTPYSRRQSLLSKSLSYFGVESTYGCAIAIVRRILTNEIARLDALERPTPL